MIIFISRLFYIYEYIMYKYINYLFIHDNVSLLTVFGGVGQIWQL